MDMLSVVKIFLLVNPLTSLPILVQAYKQKFNMKEIAYKSVILAYSVALFFTLFGNYIFMLFGISVDSLTLAGGIMIFMLGLDMTKGKDEEGKEIDQSKAIISILATPMLTGPATISYVILNTIGSGMFEVLINVSLAFVLVGAVFFVIALAIPKINVRYISLVSKILGLFLAAIGAEMILAVMKSTF
jgi:multiple antibiotic resistance protein